MKVPEICKTCKYALILAHGVRCRKRMRPRYLYGELVCHKYRRAKRFG